jgi:hypothetical protein
VDAAAVPGVLDDDPDPPAGVLEDDPDPPSGVLDDEGVELDDGLELDDGFELDDEVSSSSPPPPPGPLLSTRRETLGWAGDAAAWATNALPSEAAVIVSTAAPCMTFRRSRRTGRAGCWMSNWWSMVSSAADGSTVHYV